MQWEVQSTPPKSVMLNFLPPMLHQANLLLDSRPYKTWGHLFIWMDLKKRMSPLTWAMQSQSNKESHSGLLGFHWSIMPVTLSQWRSSTGIRRHKLIYRVKVRMRSKNLQSWPFLLSFLSCFYLVYFVLHYSDVIKWYNSNRLVQGEHLLLKLIVCSRGMFRMKKCQSLSRMR